MSCESKAIFESNRDGIGGDKTYRNTIVRGKGEIRVTPQESGEDIVYLVEHFPYAGPATSLRFDPAQIEKGISIQKETILVKLDVAVGSEVVNRIQVPYLSIDELNPTLPYAGSWNWPDVGALANEEVLNVDATIIDSKSHNVSSALVRSTRWFFGVINKDPRIATIQELKDNATDLDNSIRGKLVTSLPKSATFECGTGLYWYILSPSNVDFKMKTQLNFNPIKVDKGLVIANPNTTFSQNYVLRCNNTKNAGTVTYTLYN